MDTTIQHVYEETAKCIRCGYCLPTCPTYMVTGLEQAVARGRNYLVKALLEQQIDFSKKIKRSISECLLCAACIQNCAPGVRTPEIMTEARSAYIQQFGQSPLQRYLFRELLPYPERMTRLMKLLSFGKRSGISGLLQALRVFGWFGKDIADMEALLKTLPKRFLRERIIDFQQDEKKELIKVGYFLGCGINYAFPDVGWSTLELLKASGVQVYVLDNYCCGLPASGYGDLDAARMLAQKNIDLFLKSGCDFIVSDCASCASFLKDYYKLFQERDTYYQKAQAVESKITDITDFFNRYPIAQPLKLKEKTVVTYHDPCHLSHYLKVTTQPRSLLQKIEGVEFRELPEATWCCGGAGTYNISHHRLSQQILDRKMRNLKSTGAQVLVTACPGCMIQLSFGVRRQKLPVQVKHINQLLHEAVMS